MSNVDTGTDKIPLDSAEVTEDIDNIKNIDVNAMIPFIQTVISMMLVMENLLNPKMIVSWN